MPVVLAGSGPEGPRLRDQAANASIPVQFIEDPGDALLYALYQAATAFVFPAIEDFGIMPVEAMAVGTPVVVRAIGGGSETVIDGVTGAHLPVDATPADFRSAIARASTADAEACRKRALRFDGEQFAEQLRAWVSRPIMGSDDRVAP
jgi:glycosyltransferase involved in cell wall biosynthesis